VSFGALGLLIASRVQTIEGASGLMNFVMLPMWILSGVFFSAQRFPDALQPFIKALPLTAAIDALRANILQGASLAGVAPQAGVLAAWLACSCSCSLCWSRRCSRLTGTGPSVAIIPGCFSTGTHSRR
jgi:ABC-type multidrug transport system permease subunit